MRGAGEVADGAVSAGGLFGEAGGLGVAGPSSWPQGSCCACPERGVRLRPVGPGVRMGSSRFRCGRRQVRGQIRGSSGARVSFPRCTVCPGPSRRAFSLFFLVWVRRAPPRRIAALCALERGEATRARFALARGGAETADCVCAAGTRGLRVTQPAAQAAAFSAVGLSARTPCPFCQPCPVLTLENLRLGMLGQHRWTPGAMPTPPPRPKLHAPLHRAPGASGKQLL